MQKLMQSIFKGNALIQWQILAIAISLVILSFPEYSLQFKNGIDAPLYWLFNHLFKTGLAAGQDIVFPHGPLAFLMYPLPENILTTIIVTSILKISLVFGIFGLLNKKHSSFWLLGFALSFLLLKYLYFNQLIIANILFGFLNYYAGKNHAWKYYAYFLLVFAFYVKAYVVIVSAAIAGSFWLFMFFYEKKYWRSILELAGISLLLYLFWLALFGASQGFFQNIYGTMQLARDNSAAAAYYPYNNYWFLGGYLLVFFILPFAIKDKRAVFFGLITVLGLFAAWKHGIAREDVYHVRKLLFLSLMLASAFLVFVQRHRWLNIIILGIGISLLYLNMEHAVNYKAVKYELLGVRNFKSMLCEYDDIKTKAVTKSQEAIRAKRLPDTICQRIGKSRTDIYPWDYSIIPANDLNWQARPVIQSYASYTPWLDELNARHITSDKAPDFFLWDTDKTTSDFNGGNVESINNRYLLNNEPRFLLQFIRNYAPDTATSGMMLFKKRSHPLVIKRTSTEIQELSWNTWVDVPDNPESLQMLELHIRPRILRRIKSFVYKDEMFHILYQTEDGSIYKYRIVPKNAETGIWINPFVYSMNTPLQLKNVSHIMLKSSKTWLSQPEIPARWHSYEFRNGDHKSLERFFPAVDTTAYTDSLILYAIQDFESLYTDWLPGGEGNRIITGSCNSGEKACAFAPQHYSSTWHMRTDSLPEGNAKLRMDCWIKPKGYKKDNSINMYLSLEESPANFWRKVHIDPQIISTDGWNHVVVEKEFTNPGTGLLKAFLWNGSDVSVYIDDMRVRLYGKKQDSTMQDSLNQSAASGLR